MNISAFFIRNPIPGVMLFIILSIAGIFGFSKMEVKLFPDLDVPIVVTSIVVPGASPEQLENEVARKVENKIASLTNIKHVYSTLQDNLATITAEFTLEKNPQDALDDVRSAVNEVRGDLPATAEPPIVTNFNFNENPLFIYGVSSTTLDDVDLSWFIDNTINKKLLGIGGVANVHRVGGVQREVQVLVQPEALQANSLTVNNISQQIFNMQRNFSGGSVEIGGKVQPVRTRAAINTIDDLNNLSLMMPNGSTAPLSSIATVNDTHKKPSSIAMLNGSKIVSFIVKRSKGYGDVEVGRKVRVAIEELRARYPDLTITEVYETVSIVEEDFNGSIRMLAEGALLAVFVVLLFLGGRKPTLAFIIGLTCAYLVVMTINASWAIYIAMAMVLVPIVLYFNRFRTTIVAAVALPLSLLPAFAGMYLLDVSMNMMVTLALSLVIGILVDDAIVEVENIDRHMTMGKSPYVASIEAADEIGMAVIAITTTLIAVFLPTSFMPGIPGKFFYQFGVAASLAIFSSLLVARVITPMMCAYFLKPQEHNTAEPFWMPAYLKLAQLTLKFRWLTVAAAVAFFVVSMMVLQKLPKDFIPPSDASFTQVKIELSPGVELDTVHDVAERARVSLADIPYIQRVFSSIGGHTSNEASLFLTFSKRGTRPVKREVENMIRKRLEQVGGARFIVTSGGNGEVYEMVLTGDNPDQLRTATQNIIKEVRDVEGLGSIANSSGLTRDELIITPDVTKAAQKGVTSAAIARTVRLATEGDFKGSLPKFSTDERQIPIVVRLTDSVKKDIESLEDLLVPGKKGPVRIGDVASLSIAAAPIEIKRRDRQRFVKLEIEITSGELGEVQNRINALPSVQNLPAGIQQIASGDAEVMQELAVSFIMAMGAAILCIYFVLILLFGQLSQPITILAALPLSIGGAVIGLILVKSGMSLSSMIGFLMLMGIAVKNSILLIEYTIDIRKKNPTLQRTAAVMDACHKRARPIIMTTIAMGAGMLPLIAGLGDADPSFRRPMAAAVFGGLITSTFLSLIVIPAIYTIVDDITNIPQWLRNKSAQRKRSE